MAAPACRGFDCGPANALLDAWALRHLGKPYDEGGRFAARGRTDTALLAALLAEPYFDLPPPKSTGRDLFNPDWLETRLQAFAQVAPEDVQATLTTLTAVTVAREIARHAPDCRAVYVCGGGARNPVLMSALGDALAAAGLSASLDTTAALGVPPQQVEAIAFAWLAYRFTARLGRQHPRRDGRRRRTRARRALSALKFAAPFLYGAETAKTPRTAWGFACTGRRDGARANRSVEPAQTENDEPQPQVVVAFGFLITNCAPFRSSL